MLKYQYFIWMPSTKIKIKKLIINSIFLDLKRKKALLCVLEDLSVKEMDRIFELLSSEKDILNESLNRIVKSGQSSSVVEVIKGAKSLCVKGNVRSERMKIQECKR